MSSQKETHVATVSKNADPDKAGRIQVICAGITGSDEAAMPSWIEPALDWGWFYVPDVGQTVEIEMVTGTSEDEQPGQSSIATHALRWRGARFATDEDPIGSEFTSKNYGKRRGFKTPRGHFLMFDDTQGDEALTLAFTGGLGAVTQQATLSMTNSGIEIKDQAGNVVLLDSSTGSFKIQIKDASQNEVTLDATGATVKSPIGVTLDAPKLKYKTPNPLAATPLLNLGLLLEALSAPPVFGIVPVPTDGGTALLAGMTTKVIAP